MTTRRYRKIKTPVSKRKQRRTRRKRGVKGGTLSNCIEDCNEHKDEYKRPVAKCIEECHKLWPANPLDGLPTKENPTTNGWYITTTYDRHWGTMYFLHNMFDPEKSVYQQILQLNAQGIVPLWLHKFENIDLPILGHISRGGYVLSILRIDDQNKLMWKRGATLNSYVHGEEPTD